MTFINASYLSTVPHTRDTEANGAKVILVLGQYCLTRNTELMEK